MESTQHRHWVYILASPPHGTLYIGVTNNILGRIELHRDGKGSGFTSKYGLTMLVWFEEFDRVEEAIQREKSLKRYMREWKINLIEQYGAISILGSRHATTSGAERGDGWVLGTSPRMTSGVGSRPLYFKATTP